MSLGGIISDAANAAINGYNGTTGQQNTTIEDFLTNFSDSAGRYAKQLNPLNTFEISFKFSPPLPAVATGDEKDPGLATQIRNALAATGTSLWNSVKSTISDTLNNATGGLVGSIASWAMSEGVKKSHDEFSNAGTNSFMEYLAPANLIVGSENTWFGTQGESSSPLELQLGYYVQSITLPRMKIASDEKSTTMLGEFPINGTYVTTDTNQMQLDILNTKLPLIERIFYPWMREVTLPYWAYEDQPYTTAEVTIDFNKHTDMKYVFVGCRPTNLEMIHANQQNNQNFNRQVTLSFDAMFVTSKLATRENAGSQLWSTATSLLGSGATMLNF